MPLSRRASQASLNGVEISAIQRREIRKARVAKFNYAAISFVGDDF